MTFGRMAEHSEWITQPCMRFRIMVSASQLSLATSVDVFAGFDYRRQGVMSTLNQLRDRVMSSRDYEMVPGQDNV